MEGMRTLSISTALARSMRNSKSSPTICFSTWTYRFTKSNSSRNVTSRRHDKSRFALINFVKSSSSLASCSFDFNILPLRTLNTKCGEIRLRTLANLSCMMRILSCAYCLRERMKRRANIRMMTTTSDTAATVMVLALWTTAFLCSISSLWCKRMVSCAKRFMISEARILSRLCARESSIWASALRFSYAPR